ncbi:MAG: type II secretion system GspH family protein [Heliobacteriaceae bacterium]|jgi:prepilin-type N-terminal cleavage/methylation domain-containing protein|nr:type II secretion system GspH family protein [Heliobacteriaceae bacterium]
MKKRDLGFTLAEVLITLGIIGVVASLTMPALISNYKKQHTITGLKREYAVLAQMVKLSQADNGNFDEWDWSLNLADFVNAYLAPYLQLIRNCGITDNTCWLPDSKIYDTNGNAKYDTTSANYYTGVLNNGTYVAFEKQDNNHLHFYIDINGAKRPNKLGVDSFLFTFTRAPFLETGVHNISHSGLHFYAQGMPTANHVSNCKKASTGTHCGALYVQSGWQIPDSVDIF